MARRLGIRTPVSRNLAMILGGLRQGVTPLDMAHAYETFARGGKLTYGTLSPGAPAEGERVGLPVPGPVGLKTIGRFDDGKLRPIELPNGRKAQNERRERRVLSPAVAGSVASLLSGVVQSGTAVRAQIPGVFVAGKTGTTENYGDAWFVGWTREITVAVWVGYPDELRPMETEFAGEPVAGGTYPAMIFKDFVAQAMDLGYVKSDLEDDVSTTTTPAPTAPATSATPAPTVAPATPVAPEQPATQAAPDPAPTEPEPAEPVEPAPATEQPAPEAAPEAAAPADGATAPP